MLTHGPMPDPKCKLSISSFLTFPHLLDYLIWTKNSVWIVVLAMMGDGIGWAWLIHIRVWVGGDREWVLSHSFFYLCFCLLVAHIVSVF